MKKLGFAVLATALVAGQASAADLITNGTFATNIVGWTVVSPGTCNYMWTSTPIAGVTGGHALAGASAISTCGFYQQVTIPAGTTNSLTVTLGSISNGSSTGDIGRLQIRSTSDAVLQTLYSHSGSSSDPITSRGPYNLNAYAGQTIRIYFETNHQTAIYGQRIDNVVLDSVALPAAVPTMTEWAMILFGTILAGGAALYIQRRRQFI